MGSPALMGLLRGIHLVTLAAPDMRLLAALMGLLRAKMLLAPLGVRIWRRLPVFCQRPWTRVPL